MRTSYTFDQNFVDRNSETLLIYVQIDLSIDSIYVLIEPLFCILLARNFYLTYGPNPNISKYDYDFLTHLIYKYQRSIYL
jgi:hypothetical protein